MDKEIEDRLGALGLELPEVPALTTVNPHRRTMTVHGDLAFVSGVGPIGLQGMVGRDLSVEEGYAAARLAGLYMLRRIRDELATLDRVSRWLKVLGFVRAPDTFEQHPDVLNGFSDLIIELYGERGQAARSAIGTSSLPLQMPVEIEAVIAIR